MKLNFEEFIEKFVEEDNTYFSNDPNDRFFRDRCYDFVKKHLHRFVEILDRDEIPMAATCKCGGKGHFSNYWYLVMKCECDKNDEITEIHFDQDYLDYFFDGDPEKAGEETNRNPDMMFDKLFIFECMECGSWYVCIQ